ncbi:serine/threonine protein kinase [Streptomyces sp. NBC_00444]|uniref:serine/threonine-protein kinase n=1 Tax=Streptomyces sp. NBC_00444 TaxID=2975744 RepID=UPI002E206F10
MRVGRKFGGGRYQLTEPLGKGSMGSVWRAEDLHLARPVAIKLAVPEGSEASRSRLRARFEREAKAVARLDHPAITAVHDAGVDESGVCWLAMQVIEGPTLGDLLAERGEPLTVTEAAAIAAQLCGGLAVAHDAGLVHRDLKPDNIMIRRDGQVKILDFGLVKLIDDDALTRLTTTGENLGNFVYASPELLRRVPDLDGRSDLYAVGCLLHHLLAGHPPFPTDPPAALPGRHLHEKPPELADCGNDVPAPLQQLINRLLAKSRDERPANAAQVYADLVPYLPKPVKADPALPEDPTRPFRFPSAPFPSGVKIAAGR